MWNIALPDITTTVVIDPDIIVQTGVQVGVVLGGFLSQLMGQLGAI